MPGMYLYRVGRGIRHQGYLSVDSAPSGAGVSPAVRGGILPPRGGRDAHRTAAGTAALRRGCYRFATMSNSTRSSFFTFTAPPPMLMGSIPKSLCFSCTEP